jgi:hypothetical protein
VSCLHLTALYQLQRLWRRKEGKQGKRVVKRKKGKENWEREKERKNESKI